MVRPDKGGAVISPALDLFSDGDLSGPAAEAVRCIAAGSSCRTTAFSWPFTAWRRSTRRRVGHDGGVVNTWCALDAIGIPPVATPPMSARCDTRGTTPRQPCLTEREPDSGLLNGGHRWFPLPCGAVPTGHRVAAALVVLLHESSATLIGAPRGPGRPGGGRRGPSGGRDEWQVTPSRSWFARPVQSDPRLRVGRGPPVEYARKLFGHPMGSET